MSDQSGKKYDAGKPRLDLLSVEAITDLSKVLEFGARKYDPWNWSKGIAYSRLSAAALRHMFSWMNGEDLDPESGLPHLAHAMCNIMFLLDFKNRQDLDDRRRSVKSST